MQDYLAEHIAQLEQQQRALAQLSQEMRTQLEQQQAELEKRCSETEKQLAKKKDRIEGHALEKPPLYQVIILIVLFAGMGILLFILLYRLMSHLPTDHINDALTLISTLLALTGGLYLAYDILEGQNKLLTWLTTYATYVLIGTLIGALTAWWWWWPIMLNLTEGSELIDKILGFILADGGIMGVLGGTLMLIMHNTLKKPRFLSLKAWLVDCFLSCLFYTLLILYLLTKAIPSGMPSTLLGVLILLIFLIPTTILFHCLRYFIGNKLAYTQTKFSLFCWKDALVAFIAWCPVWIIIALMVQVSWGSVQIGALLTLAGAITAGIARFALLWAGSLAGRTLGIFGLCLTSMGIILLCITPVTHLISK